MQVAFLVLCTQHIHDFAVLWSASRALGLALSVAFKAVLVEGVAAQEMNRRQLQGAVAHVTLGFLEYLGTVWKYSIGVKIYIHTNKCNQHLFASPHRSPLDERIVVRNW